MTHPHPRYKPGDKIGGRYEVHKALMGGMGEVYLCLDLEEMYPYALKTFQPRYQSPALKKTFEQEVATWVALEKHPNIVRCFYMDILDNQPFMVLEWIAGEEGKGTDLRGWLRHGPLDLRTALEITVDVVRGLLHAQEKQPGLVHRDLKPENVLVAQGGLAKITDFGLAQMVAQAGLQLQPASNLPGVALREEDIASSLFEGGRHSLARIGNIAGTPAYMAPEQWRGESLDERTDIYAIGCILYELLTGEGPYRVDFMPTTPPQFQQWLRVMQTGHESALPPALPPAVPNEVSHLVESCLAKRPAERQESLVSLLAQVEALYRQQFDGPPPSRSPASEMTAVEYNNRGVTYGALQRYEEALRDFDQAIKLDPNYAQAYYNRGTTTYGTLQRYEEALRDFDQAIKLDPNYAKAYYNRGVTYTALQRYEEALRDYGRAINLDPNLAQAYYNRGTTYADLQRYEEALGDFDRAIELDPNDAQAYSNRGNTYAALQRHEEALRDYDQAIELDPNDAQAYSNRGNTYAALERHEEALRDYDQAIELDPNDATAYLNLGALLGNQGMHRESLPYFEKAAQLDHPQGAQYAAMARQALGMTPAPPPNPAQAAFETFQQAASPEAMGQTVSRFPFMVQADFIAAIEQAIAQQVPPEHRSYFKQRLGWLRQIAQEME